MTSRSASSGGRRAGPRLRSSLDDLVGRAPQSARPFITPWLQWANHRFGQSIIAAAEEEARQGRLASLQIGPAVVSGALRGGTRPTTVTMHLPALTATQWRHLLEALAREAMSEASLLAGELPPGLIELADTAGAALVPSADESLQVLIEPDRGDVEQQRIGAVVLLCLFERLVHEPALVFMMRGKPLDEVLEELRELRLLQVQGAATTHSDPFIAATSQPAPPLEECLDGFWGSGALLSELEHMPPTHHAPHALLRRLGQSTLGGKFPLVGLLASVYDAVAVAARQMRDHAEHIDVNGPVDAPAEPNADA